MATTVTTNFYKQQTIMTAKLKKQQSNRSNDDGDDSIKHQQ